MGFGQKKKLGASNLGVFAQNGVFGVGGTLGRFCVFGRFCDFVKGGLSGNPPFSLYCAGLLSALMIGSPIRARLP